MRFLMVTSFYPPHHFGGDAVYVRQLSRALVQRGHSVRVVYCYDSYAASGGKLGADVVREDDGVEVHMLSSRFGVLSPLLSHQTGWAGLKARTIASELSAPVDVVNFHNVSLMGAPAILSQATAPVKLLTSHDHWLVCASHIFWKNGREPCDKRTCLRCQIASKRPPQLWRGTGMLNRRLAALDRILAPSAYTAAEIARQYPALPSSVLPLFAPTAYDILAEGTVSEEPRFVYAGRVTRSKGIDRIARLFRHRPGYRLDVLGDGDLLGPLRSELGDLPNVEFHGQLEQHELPRFYRRATATILPSLAPESFGLTTIEGFAQGTPAIARDAGAAGEPIRQHGAGIVFDTDEAALEALDRLAGDAALRMEMGERARKAYLRYYTQDVHLEAYLREVAGSTPCQPAVPSARHG